MDTDAFYLNEPVEITAENPTQYHIKYQDGFEELVDKTNVVVYKKGIKKSNPARQAKNFEKYYGSIERVKWIQSQPCVINNCGKLPSDNIHIVSKSAGGTFMDIIPGCRSHHLELHQLGILTFSEKYKVDLVAIAKKFAKIKP